MTSKSLSGDHPRGGYLSSNFFHPDCPHCGAGGDLLVTKRHGDPSTEWTCVACEKEFDSPRDSRWFGVRQLPKTQKDAYITLEISDIPIKYYAKSRGVKVASARSRLKRARRSLREMREPGSDPVPEPWASRAPRDENGDFLPATADD